MVSERRGVLQIRSQRIAAHEGVSASKSQRRRKSIFHFLRQISFPLQVIVKTTMTMTPFLCGDLEKLVQNGRWSLLVAWWRLKLQIYYWRETRRSGAAGAGNKKAPTGNGSDSSRQVGGANGRGSEPVSVRTNEPVDMATLLIPTTR